MEAELGSENEAHDHKKKKIRDRQEDSDDSQGSLQDFVDLADEKEIGGADEEMYKKFQKDTEQD